MGWRCAECGKEALYNLYGKMLCEEHWIEVNNLPKDRSDDDAKILEKPGGECSGE